LSPDKTGTIFFIRVFFPRINVHAPKEKIMPEQTLKGKVALVGAGAKNLGGLISRTLGAEGASVVAHYSSDGTKSSAGDTVRTIEKGGSEAFAVQGDLTNVSEVIRTPHGLVPFQRLWARS
jgi:hypothetical protein